MLVNLFKKEGSKRKEFALRLCSVFTKEVLIDFVPYVPLAVFHGISGQCESDDERNYTMEPRLWLRFIVSVSQMNCDFMFFQQHFRNIRTTSARAIASNQNCLASGFHTGIFRDVL